MVPEAEELAKGLLDEIGNEMFERTGGDRYRAKQPLLSDPSVETPAAVSPPAPTPEAATEEASSTPGSPGGETSQGAEPEWFLPGLYKTREEADKGIRETKRYASEAMTRAKEAERRLEPVEPPKPPSDPLSELENYGVPKELMAKAMELIARETLQKTLEPAAKRMEADAKIVSMYPEYQTKFNDLTAFVESDPELLSKVTRAEAAGEFLLARELAWLNYERANAVRKVAEVTQEQERRVTEARRTMPDATVMKPSQSESRTKPVEPSPNNLSEKQFDDLVELAKAGYNQPLWRNTIGLQLERDYPSIFGPGM